MPLAFESQSHGTIAFGFFNLETDLLLLDRYFLFADDFCSYIQKIAEIGGDQPYQACWPIHFIEAAADIGDLMGAIKGVRFTGFIGELYRRFPFPSDHADFKQNPEGYRIRQRVSGMIAKFSEMCEVSVAMPGGGQEIHIGVYRFNREQYQKLIAYVWRGGYPRWKDETRPGYVNAMRNAVLQNRRGIFDGIVLG